MKQVFTLGGRQTLTNFSVFYSGQLGAGSNAAIAAAASQAIAATQQVGFIDLNVMETTDAPLSFHNPLCIRSQSCP